MNNPAQEQIKDASARPDVFGAALVVAGPGNAGGAEVRAAVRNGGGGRCAVGTMNACWQVGQVICSPA
jgi:hypothetical protein